MAPNKRLNASVLAGLWVALVSYVWLRIGIIAETASRGPRLELPALHLMETYVRIIPTLYLMYDAATQVALYGKPTGYASGFARFACHSRLWASLGRACLLALAAYGGMYTGLVSLYGFGSYTYLPECAAALGSLALVFVLLLPLGRLPWMLIRSLAPMALACVIALDIHPPALWAYPGSSGVPRVEDIFAPIVLGLAVLNTFVAAKAFWSRWRRAREANTG